MYLTQEEAIERLKTSLNFEHRTAVAYVRAAGKCEYCQHELILDRLIYATAQIDHLLPRAKYSEHITGNENNFVLSCYLCNLIKRDISVLLDGENPEEMLDNQRAELIRRAHKLITKNRTEPDNLWQKAKYIFESIGGV